MAREFIDGFETGDISLWDSVQGTPTYVNASSYGLQGAKAFSLSGGCYLYKNLTPRNAYWFALKIRTYGGWYGGTGIGNTTTLIHLRSSDTTTLATIRAEGDGRLALYVGTTREAVYNTPLGVGLTYLIEFYYLPKTDASGSFILRLNGVECITFTGVTSAAALQIGQLGIGSDHYSQIFDDVVIDSAGWIGQTHIQPLLPTGAGTNTSWTPSTGANYACVDEVPGSDTDYVATNTANAVDSYAMGDLTGSVGGVKTVQVVARALKQGVPTPTGLKGVLRSAGTDYPSAATATISTAAKGYGFLWETDPATSAAWTTTNVNAIEVGVKAV